MCDHVSLMIAVALLLGVASLVLGAVFSGTETAFYRVSKLRLKLDALSGDTTAKRFLWFANNPGFFIATLLLGNNTTTYGASVAMVLFVGCVLPHADGVYAELTATLLLTPILFVWGEMFPKCLGLTIPNKILRFFAPIIVIFCWLFLPFTAILWGVNKILAIVLKKSEDAISLSLGHRELSRILAEGEETGILSDTQRRLAEGIFNCSERFIKDYTLPRPMLPAITTAMRPEYALEIARKSRQLVLAVYEADTDPDRHDLPIGYVRTIDLEIAVRHQLDEQARQLAQLLQTELPLRSLVELSSRHSLLTGLILLQTMRDSFGCVVDEHRRYLGFISADQLRDVLLGKQNPPQKQSTERSSSDGICANG
jgi:CBS domain containing-hemolysin-like protein